MTLTKTSPVKNSFIQGKQKVFIRKVTASCQELMMVNENLNQEVN
jgi:hypothetical protein